jgi:transposase-like protein
MEHRKFKKRLAELITELTPAQGCKLIEAFREQCAGEETQKLIDGQFQADLKCPHCEGKHIHRHGMARGLQRYKCPGCARTFNALTGTPLARLRKRDRWLKFAEALSASQTVRMAAARAGIDKSTSFRWRHRFLTAQKGLQDQRLTGITEVDECFILQSRKGERHLPCKARKRGGKAKKPGLSSEQTPVLIARDRYGHHLDAVVPDRSEDAVSAVLKQAVLKADVLLCMDGDPALIAFAKKEVIEYELILASHGEHVHEKVLHIQTVNGYIRRFKQWLDRFKGVTTKYLSNYLGWRRLLEKSAPALTPDLCLTNAIG